MSSIPTELRDRLTVPVPIAARVLGVGRNQAYSGVADGSIPSVRIGGRILVPVVPLLRMLGIDDSPPVAQEAS